MKSVKKFSLGLVALISLISVVFITASPNGVQATHDAANPHAAVPNADKAAIFVTFSDESTGTDFANGSEVIWTIEWSSSNCVAPVGGVLHKGDGTSNYQALGATGNQAGVQLITHNSVDSNNPSAVGNLDPCFYSIAVTTSLQCTIKLDIADAAGGSSGNGQDVIAIAGDGAKDTTDTVSAPNRAIAQLQGATTFETYALNASFFNRDFDTTFIPNSPPPGSPVDASGNPAAQAANDGIADVVPPEIASLDRVVIGGLAKVTTPGLRISHITNATGDTPGAATNVVQLTAASCSIPTGGGGAIRLHSAEPAGSLELATDITPVSGCNPSGTSSSGEQSVRPGRSNELETVALDSNCRYTLTVGHAVSQSLDQSNGALVLCEARGWAYQVTDAATPAAATGVGLSDEDVGDDARELSFSRTGNSIFLDESTNHFVRLTLYISSNCPTYGQFSLAYNVLAGTSGALHQTPVSPTITPVAGSADVCRATPALVDIRGRNEVVGLDGGAITGSTATNISVDVAIVLRPRLGRACQYDIQYPLVSSALQLAFEHGGRADDPTTGSANDPMNEFSTPDGTFDGRITVSAITLNSNTYTFTYVTRALPISITMQFPDEVEFKTSDQVDYLISVPGACARFSPILGRALGNTGTFRSPQAYPGSTLIYDRSLQALESQNSQDSDLLYTLQPVVIVSGNTLACSVQVEELSTPEGCEVLGTNPRSLTYAADLPDFSFTFEHDCSVLIEEIGGRQITA